MRHNNAGRKLGRNTSHRKALFKNMSLAMIQNGRIRTTLFKAKELRSVVEHLITLGKQDTLHARRVAFNLIRCRESVGKLFKDIAPRFAKRAGGYTRIMRLDARPGDNASMAFIEFLREDTEGVFVKKVKKSAKEAA